MALEPITRQEQIIAGKDLEPITRMERFLKEYGGGSGNSVQSDWNQTDETAADFIRNRPFGEMYGDTLYWDGNTEGLEVDSSGTSYKVSDVVLSEDEITNCILQNVNASTVQKQFFDGIGMIFGIPIGAESEAEAIYILSAPVDNCDVFGDGYTILPSAGLWAVPNAFTLTIPGYTGFSAPKQIDEKYLPGAVILYTDGTYLYSSADTSDTTNRMTKAELKSVILSSRTVYVYIYEDGNPIYLTVDHFLFSGSFGRAYCADINMAFYTAEYVPNTTT